MNTDYRIDESAIPTVEPSVEPTEVYMEEIEDDRAVYDGEVSDSILRKLSAYYNEHAALDDEYVILRESQYVYILAYGSEQNHRFTGTIVRYTSSSYTVDATVSVTSGTYTADMTGDTGYIYSSLPEYIPSYYIDSLTAKTHWLDSITNLALLIGLFSACIFTLFRKLTRK